MLGALMAGALLLALVTQNTAPPMVVMMLLGARSWRMKRYRRRIKTPTMA